eukprot:UN30199
MTTMLRKNFVRDPGDFRYCSTVDFENYSPITDNLDTLASSSPYSVHLNDRNLRNVGYREEVVEPRFKGGNARDRMPNGDQMIGANVFDHTTAAISGNSDHSDFFKSTTNQSKISEPTMLDPEFMLTDSINERLMAMNKGSSDENENAIVAKGGVAGSCDIGVEKVKSLECAIDEDSDQSDNNKYKNRISITSQASKDDDSEIPMVYVE